MPDYWEEYRARRELKLSIRKMGSRYLFICLYIGWKVFSRGDYKKQ